MLIVVELIISQLFANALFQGSKVNRTCLTFELLGLFSYAFSIYIIVSLRLALRCHDSASCIKVTLTTFSIPIDPVSSNTAPPNEPLPTSTNHSFAQPPAHNIPLEKLPSPKPPRKSILSLKLDRDLRPDRRFVPKTVSVVGPAITKPPVTRRDDVAASGPENREPLKPPGLVSGAVRQSNKFVWEQTLLETAKEAGPESQENCQHQ